MNKVNYVTVRKYIEVKFPNIQAEFHDDQIRSITPIILTVPCMGDSGATIDRCISNIMYSFYSEQDSEIFPL